MEIYFVSVIQKNKGKMEGWFFFPFVKTIEEAEKEVNKFLPRGNRDVMSVKCIKRIKLLRLENKDFIETLSFQKGFNGFMVNGYYEQTHEEDIEDMHKKNHNIIKEEQYYSLKRYWSNRWYR